ncbi:hypothetical protein Pelo_2567 [Pelomyxa schiedti]|nr:hypothetical protein Pelo_2567 [Pelomyxa schiedti]
MPATMLLSDSFLNSPSSSPQPQRVLMSGDSISTPTLPVVATGTPSSILATASAATNCHIPRSRSYHQSHVHGGRSSPSPPADESPDIHLSNIRKSESHKPSSQSPTLDLIDKNTPSRKHKLDKAATDPCLIKAKEFLESLRSSREKLEMYCATKLSPDIKEPPRKFTSPEMKDCNQPFGAPLSSLETIVVNNLLIPVIIHKITRCLSIIVKNNITCSCMCLTDPDGFRIQKAGIYTGALPIEEISEPNTLINILLSFFEELPQPLLPSSLLPALSSPNQTGHTLKVVIEALPKENRHLLQFMLEFIMQNCEYNSLHECSAAFGVAFAHCTVEKSSARDAIHSLLHNFETIFLIPPISKPEEQERNCISLAHKLSLIALLVCETPQEPDFLSRYCLTYRYHTTPKLLFSTLLRICLTIPLCDSAHTKQRKLAQLQKVFVKLFECDSPELSVHLEIDTEIKLVCGLFPVIGQRILELQLPVIDNNITAPPPSEQIDLWAIDPSALAEQVTILFYKTFRKVPLPAFTSAPQENKKMAKALQNMVDLCNKLTMWAVSEIVTTNSPKTVGRFISLAQKCLHLNNFAAAFSLYLALLNQNVQRLEDATKKISRSKQTMYDELTTFCSLESNFGVYRRRAIEAQLNHKPCIPCIAVVQHDIEIIDALPTTIMWPEEHQCNQPPEPPPTETGDQGHPAATVLSASETILDRLTAPLQQHPPITPQVPREPLVNCNKFRQTSSVLLSVANMQRTPYDIEPNINLQNALLNVTIWPDDILERWSLACKKKSTP